GSEIPIAGLIGDQQAALFGQLCTEKGMVKNTYSTGNFIMMHTGDKPVFAKKNLLATIALKINGKITYALEGSVFDTGSVIQWLRDGLGIIESSSEIEQLANTEKDNGGVYFVPAFSGLGTPYWNENARGTVFGITIGTTNGHIARAALEAIVFHSMDVIVEMKQSVDIDITELRVDGGVVVNDTLLQTQADLIDSPVVRLDRSVVAALGIGYLAGLAIGYWSNFDEIKLFRNVERTFYKDDDVEKINKSYRVWKKAVERSLDWIDVVKKA
ncbi:MAG: FGGY-family carbohydrate kinase, partial [Bacteroidota bacterium]|nr:FGGY-family carbohydrate kinase [Bacteroidota bacterium]